MLAIISDIHIKEPNDEGFKLFKNFLNHPDVLKADKIILLGDIFDLLIGGDEGFFLRYKELFDLIDKHLNNGKEVYYFEGNHDFHLNRFFKKRISHKNFIFSKKMLKIRNKNEEILLCHGDDIEIDNLNYKIYSFLIKSFPIKILAELLVPFSVTEKIGIFFSGKSRKKNLENYQSKEEEIRKKFRKSAELAFENHKINIIVSGHSHIKDDFQFGDDFLYLNNGFALKEKTFLLFKNKENYSFIDL